MSKENNKIGYARVSTEEQSVDMQIEALVNAGVPRENIYQESLSGSSKNRPQLKAAFRDLRQGDTFVVWKLDRVARSLTHLLEIVEMFKQKGVHFKSITDSIDTNTPGGMLQFHMLGAFAQFERDIIRERTQAGVDRAKARGVKFGADYILQPKDMPKVFDMINKQGRTRKYVAEKYGVTTQTIYRRLKEYEASKSKKS